MRVLMRVVVASCCLVGVMSATQAATVVVSGGTSMVQSAYGEERRLSSLRADCAPYNRTSVGFLCGFDDGQRTVLQFEDRDLGPVRLFDADGREIAGVRRIGSYYVLPSLHRMVFVRVAGKEAVLMRTSDNFVVERKSGSGGGGSAPHGDPRTARAVASINKGERIDLVLMALAKSEGWEFFWYPAVSWKAVNDIDLTRYKDAAEAVMDIIDGLREEGKPVKYRISDGNKVIEVLSTEVKND